MAAKVPLLFGSGRRRRSAGPYAVVQGELQQEHIAVHTTTAKAHHTTHSDSDSSNRNIIIIIIIIIVIIIIISSSSQRTRCGDGQGLRSRLGGLRGGFRQLLPPHYRRRRRRRRQAATVGAVGAGSALGTRVLLGKGPGDRLSPARRRVNPCHAIEQKGERPQRFGKKNEGFSNSGRPGEGEGAVVPRKNP